MRKPPTQYIATKDRIPAFECAHTTPRNAFGKCGCPFRLVGLGYLSHYPVSRNKGGKGPNNQQELAPWQTKEATSRAIELGDLPCDMGRAARELKDLPAKAGTGMVGFGRIDTASRSTCLGARSAPVGMEETRFAWLIDRQLVRSGLCPSVCTGANIRSAV